MFRVCARVCSLLRSRDNTRSVSWRNRCLPKNSRHHTCGDAIMRIFTCGDARESVARVLYTPRNACAVARRDESQLVHVPQHTYTARTPARKRVIRVSSGRNLHSLGSHTHRRPVERDSGGEKRSNTKEHFPHFAVCLSSLGQSIRSGSRWRAAASAGLRVACA